MIAIEIIDIKNLMAHLLLKDTFDQFLLFEARAVTASELVLNGRRHREWYDSDRWQQMMETCGEHDCGYMTWGQMRETVFQFIKGKKSPDKLLIDLEASDRQREQILGNGEEQADRAELRLQIRYEKGTLLMIPVVSYPGFTMDRSGEVLWEEALQKFLKRCQIAFQRRA